MAAIQVHHAGDLAGGAVEPIAREVLWTRRRGAPAADVAPAAAQVPRRMISKWFSSGTLVRSCIPSQFCGSMGILSPTRWPSVSAGSYEVADTSDTTT